MSQVRITVGTSPILLSNGSANRASINITMTPTTVETGNTGNVFVGKGFVPSSAAGAPNSGDVLVQGASISDYPQFADDPSLFTGQWWAVADTAGQILVVDETLKG